MKMRASPWIAGQFAWTGFDYRGEVHPFKWPAISAYWGIVDLVGFPKDQYFLYQSDWSDKPMVHILPQNWNWPQYPGAVFPVWVYSNPFFATFETFISPNNAVPSLFKKIFALFRSLWKILMSWSDFRPLTTWIGSTTRVTTTNMSVRFSYATHIPSV